MLTHAHKLFRPGRPTRGGVIAACVIAAVAVVYWSSVLTFHLRDRALRLELTAGLSRDAAEAVLRRHGAVYSWSARDSALHARRWLVPPFLFESGAFYTVHVDDAGRVTSVDRRVSNTAW